MKNILLLSVFMVSLAVQAQYYYKDIIGTQELNAKMKTYIAAKVRSVTAAGYDERGNKTTDFNEWQDMQANNSVLKVTSRTGQSVARTYYQFDNNTRVINARDSSADAETVTTYTYDANGNLLNMKTTTKDALHDFDQTTEKQWNYKEGKLSKLLLIVNSSDSMEYSFTIDDRKNVVDEMMTHRGGVRNKLDYAYDPKKIYYFYDEQNRLTDITKYNETADRLLPDYMFTYDENNRVIQTITVLSTVQIKYGIKKPDYFIWRYGFDEKGLKTKEVLYGKEKQLKGKIEYSYTFGQ